MRNLVALPLLALAVGCSSKDSAPSAKDAPSAKAAAASGGSASAAPAPAPSGAASASAAASGSADAPPAGPPICERSKEKVWAAGVNKLTGLTTKVFGGRMAVGLAIGNEPRVLVVEKDGAAKLLPVKQSDHVKAPKPKEGFRLLMRVSPADVSGAEARAFVDYRDELKDKRRRVSCGPADADAEFLEYEGTSILDRDPKPTGDELKKLFQGDGYSELRDCRTFVSLVDQEVWALGSVLVGRPKASGETEWKMLFVVDFGPKVEGIVLHEVDLKGDPPKSPPAFEVPVSRRIKDVGWLVATRSGSSLLAAVLDTNKKATEGFRTYRGHPYMPEISTLDDDTLVLLTGHGAGKSRGFGALSISRKKPELPKEFRAVKVAPTAGEPDDAVLTAPDLATDDKGRRWLAYVEGPHDKSHLRLVPLGADLQPAGRSFTVTEGDVHASEVRLAPVPGGKLVAVYIREKDGKTELVSEELACDVKP